MTLKQGTTAFLVTAALATTGINTYLFVNYQSTAGDSSPTPSENTVTVDAVAASGYLEPKGEAIQLSAPNSIEGARVEQLLIERGEKVKAGQAIAVLDNYDILQAALQQAQTKVEVAQAQLVRVKAGSKEGEIKAAEARFQSTQAELEGQIVTQRASIASLEAQLQGQKSAQEATIERVKAELRNAQTDCDRYQSLYQNGAVSVQERDRICLQEKTAQERLKEAQANLNRIVKTLQEQITEAKANLNRTITTVQRQIEEARGTLDAVAEIRPVDVRVATAELEAARADVRRAKAELDLAYVRSPEDGQILEINTRPGEIVGDRGIVEIGQTDQMYVTAEVYETDVTKIRIGQKATIEAEGMVKDLQGTVDEIGLKIGQQDVLGTDPIADADARVVKVKIRLTPEDSQLVAGLTNLQVNVVINTPLSTVNQTDRSIPKK